MSILEIKNIKKSFGEDLEVLQDISLAVEEGEVVSILGPPVPVNRRYFAAQHF